MHRPHFAEDLMLCIKCRHYLTALYYLIKGSVVTTAPHLFWFGKRTL